LSDTDVKEFAVMPCTWSGARSAVTTVTPVANCPSARRKSEVLGVVGAIVEVFEDNTDAALGRVLVSRIINRKS
jgi:pyrroline-5-carboxylate reductase